MSDTLFEDGLKIRREVLGDKYVDASLASADEFMKPFQELVTEYCWGTVWGRDGLDRRTRSIINLSMLSALNRTAELKLHIRGAVNNGVSRKEIQEVLLQVAIYAGVPAALESFKAARDVFKEIEAEGD